VPNAWSLNRALTTGAFVTPAGSAPGNDDPRATALRRGRDAPGPAVRRALERLPGRRVLAPGTPA